MKKHLLFAAMLALSAAPVVANPSAPIYYEEGADANVEEQYQALVKSINDLENELKATIAEIQEKYPNAEDVAGALEYTITGEGGLESILKEVTAKHEAGTLTAEEIAAYQKTVDSYKEGTADALKQAASAEYSVQLNQAWQAAKEQIYAAEDNLPENVFDYFSSAMDAKGSAIDAYYYTKYGSLESYTATMVAEFEEAVKPMVAAAIAIGDAAPAASELVADMKTTLPQAKKEIEDVRTDFPDYDLTSTTETVAYYQKLLDELTNYIAEDAEPYTKAQIDNFARQLGYFKEEIANLRNTAQAETWQAEYNAKYYPVSNRISEISEILYDECPTVYGDYLTKLEDYNYEMTQAMMKFYNGTVTKEEFDAMMARVDEIAKEIEKVLEDARAAEAATGISHISIDQLGKDAKVYTLDGKRVTTVQKGLYIVNGKKVVLK